MACFDHSDRPKALLLSENQTTFSRKGPKIRIPFAPPASQSGKRDSSGRSERWVTRSGRRKDISAWSGPRLFNAAGLAELSPRCDLGRPRAWAALAARLHRSGGPAASASDDAVLTQARDRGGVEAEPVGKHFFGVLAEQWRRPRAYQAPLAPKPKTQQAVRRADAISAAQAAHRTEEAALHDRVSPESLRQKQGEGLYEAADAAAGRPRKNQRRPHGTRARDRGRETSE